MPEIFSEETFIRIISIKMVTLLQLMFFELPIKLNFEKEKCIKDGKNFSVFL